MSDQTIIQLFEAHPLAFTVLAMPLVIALSLGLFMAFRAIFSGEG
jgi:hypothetical protein